MRTALPALLPLFRSELQLRILAMFFSDPGKQWTARVIQEALGVPAASVHRELHRLLNAGLVEREAVGRTFRYRTAPDSPVYESLRELIELTVGVEAELRAQLVDFPGVEVALIHGSWVESRVSPTSDVDVLVIGDVDYADLRSRIREVERRVARDIDLIAYRPDEFRELVRVGNGFARAVLSGPKRTLVGELENVAENEPR
jgi:predicted nucleotidyltransferase